MSDELYRRLQKQLDTYSVGFPATKSGVEIRILKKLFNEDDAAVFVAMSPKLEPAGAVAPRLGLSEDAAAARLGDMADRGLLFCVAKDGVKRYGAIPFVHGLFEFQVKRLDRELADLVEEYFKDGFVANMIDNASGFLRTVPVERSVEVESRIAPYEDACAMLRDKDLIVVAECICRKAKAMVTDGCGKPREVCFMFGSMGQYYIDHQMGRRVQPDEAVALLRQAQEAGLVTQPASAKNPGGMCNCCGDCCGVLLSIRQHPKPATVVFSNHFAQVDPDLCSACGACEDRCQMDAIAVNGNDSAEIDLDRCIGCGLCVIACPEHAASLVPKPESQRRIPPNNTLDQMLAMAKTRGVL
jgi:Na+-translocating ferredoxin:NAD+ oxidoreductase subunit B